MFRIVAALLLALLIVPGALHFPLLWLMVVAFPSWLYYIFGVEERRVRAALGRELREAVERLPVKR